MGQPLKKLTIADVEVAVKTMAEIALAKEKYFSDLDAAAGDADFGVSLASGFRVVLENWDGLDRSSVGGFLMRVGMIITSNVGGCSGPIWGTGFMRAGMASKDKTLLTLDDIVVIARSSMEGMMARGGAQLGDKTLLDALNPAIDKLEEWGHKDQQDLLAAFEAASEAATATVEATRDWIARRGRQSFTGERSRGTLDPGIVAVATMMQAATEALKATHAAGKEKVS